MDSSIDAGEFQAHAWLEADGEVLIGGEELERYAAFPEVSGDEQ